MRLSNILLTMILAYALFVVFAYTYFLLPAAMDQASHLCDCATERASEPAHTPSRRQTRFLRLARGDIKDEDSTALTTAMTTAPVARKTNFKLGPTFLLILIPILPKSSESRDLIRDTWYKGFNDSEDVMMRFMMGVNGLDQSVISKLLKENTTHKDIVFLDNFTENVTALTNKTIALIKWASDNVNFTYMMKCDDDTYVYVDNAISELKRRQSTTRLYYGVMAVNTTPIVDPKNKWRDTTWNLSTVYLPYARGGGYIISGDLILLLAKQSKCLKWHLNEDVSVGSWLAAFNYERRDDDLFCYISYGQNFHPCRDDYRVAHLFHGQPKRKLKRSFYALYSQQYRSPR